MLKTVSKPAQLTGIHFSSPSLGWITGMDGSLYQSRDGGELGKMHRTDYVL